MDQIRLYHLSGRAGPAWAVLREITGAEEQTITGTSTLDGIRLLDSLLVHGQPGAIGQGDISKLSAWDREQLLAAVFIRIYGARIENTITCKACHQYFDLDFSLIELLESLKPVREEALGLEMLADGFYRFPDGLQFRLPTGEDEYAVIGCSLEEAKARVLKRCLRNGNENTAIERRGEEIQAAMNALSPLVDLPLEACCPECGFRQSVHFDLQYYLLSALQGERKRLMQEIHTLASSYGWSLAEILSLPRSQRRVLAGLVDADEGGGL